MQNSVAPHRYVVMGNPVAHSKSPVIHRLFAQQTGEPVSYDLLELPVVHFLKAAQQFFDDGGAGANVTVPFKLDAYLLASRLTERARIAAAVNTLRREPDGTLSADNTDGAGLIADIVRNAGQSLSGRRILLVGAGGAARGVVLPLLQEQPGHIVIVNRTAQSAIDLAALFQQYAIAGGTSVSGIGLNELNASEDRYHRHFDIVINATSASLHGNIPPLPDQILARGAFVYDMMYGATLATTPFLDWAIRQDATVRTRDGLGMLIEQAAEAFFYWRGVRPETADVFKTLRPPK